MRTIKKCKEMLENYKYEKFISGDYDKTKFQIFCECQDAVLEAYEKMFPSNETFSEEIYRLRTIMMARILLPKFP